MARTRAGVNSIAALTLVVACASSSCAQVRSQDSRPTGGSPIWDLLPDRPAETRAATFAALRERRDVRDLAPLGDLLRFSREPDEWFALLDALQPLFEEKLREQSGVWNLVTRETARRIADTAQPLVAHHDYPQWKGELLALAVDPAFRRFFPAGVVTRIRLEEVVWGGVEVDGIPSLDDPEHIVAADAEYLSDDEAVFGLAWGGEARAYPLRILDWHEMANDELAGVSFALAYCTLCGAAVAYRTAYDDGVHRFGSSGLLMRSNKLMFDRETDSLWNQLTGEPVTGPLCASGVRLDVLPVVMTTWGEWKSRHPATTTLSVDTGFDRRYEPGAAYGRYFARPDAMFPAVSPRPDGQGPALGAARPLDKEQLFVVREGGDSGAFRRSEVEATGLLHGRVGERGIVLVGRKRGEVELPLTWVEVLSIDGGATPSRFSDLGSDAAVALLREPARLAELDAERLLAMRPATRSAVLQEFGPDRDGEGPRLGAALRDAVAVRALIAPIRAYSVGPRKFSFDREQPDRLLDGAGVAWLLTEEALLTGSGDALPRLPGHLVFGLGWRAFLAVDD